MAKVVQVAHINLLLLWLIEIGSKGFKYPTRIGQLSCPGQTSTFPISYQILIN